jgi:hypothetical protein
MKVFTLDELDTTMEAVERLPIDLTDERVSVKGPRLWDGFMDNLVIHMRDTPDEDDRLNWMGWDISGTHADVRHTVFTFGNEQSRSHGKLLILSLTRNEGETLVLASHPSKLGGMSEFKCRASSDHVAAVLRMLAKTAI